MKTIAISGCFDPIHKGHIRLLKAAKKLGMVVIILNNDNYLMQKKGYVFMPEEVRKEVLKNLRFVDSVILSKHKKGFTDGSVSAELEDLLPDVYANGGDVTLENTPEREICSRLGIKLVFGLGGDKIASSSEIVRMMNI